MAFDDPGFLVFIPAYRSLLQCTSTCLSNKTWPTWWSVTTKTMAETLSSVLGGPLSLWSKHAATCKLLQGGTHMVRNWAAGEELTPATLECSCEQAESSLSPARVSAYTHRSAALQAHKRPWARRAHRASWPSNSDRVSVQRFKLLTLRVICHAAMDKWYMETQQRQAGRRLL